MLCLCFVVVLWDECLGEVLIVRWVCVLVLSGIICGVDE